MSKLYIEPVFYAADLESKEEEDTKAQTETSEWSSAIVKFHTEDVKVFRKIVDTLRYLNAHTKYGIVYYHNIKFDGSFLLDWFLNHGFKNGFDKDGIHYKSKFNLKQNELSCFISADGQWYAIYVNYKGTLIEFRDSSKLLPFTLAKIGKDFKTKHQKLEMEYKGDHLDENGKIKKEYLPYICSDVLLLKEALEIFQVEHGLDKLTIGACCLAEYKNMVGPIKWEEWFPNLSNIKLDEKIYGSSNVDEYIRHSYYGGVCFIAKGKEGIHRNGITVDVNSLYPSMMSSQSGSCYPVGLPTFWQGAIPKEAKKKGHYYFVRIKCRFKIKDGFLPWIHIRGNIFYTPTECLEDSDFTISKIIDGEVVSRKVSRIGKVEAKPTLTFTQTDYELFKKHYDVYDEEVLDGCWFKSEAGIFDKYIDKYAELKQKSTGAIRVICKLFMNSLYGKFSQTSQSSYKVPFMRKDSIVGFHDIIEYNKDTLFIACGSAITSYARNFTMTAAQLNYHGKDKPGTIYVDTDSIHADIKPEELVGVPIHQTKLNHWKIESYWDVAQFTRQKTYIEHVTHENGIPMEELTDDDGNPLEPYYNVKCAGMNDKCKENFVDGLESRKFTLSDFTEGLELDGKLVPRRVKGGIVLTDTTYKML